MLIPTLLSLVAPHECLGCSAEGSLLCADCCSQLRPSESRCFRCRVDTLDFTTCPGCIDRSSLARVRSVAAYDGAAKDLIWKLKFGRARAAASEMADLMTPLLPAVGTAPYFITHAPTATSRIRQRGYDQAALIAKALARHARMPYAPLLVKTDQHKQVGASRSLRIEQLQQAYRPIRSRHIHGARILLVDDVITTGSTLQSAATTLRQAGASHVEALVFAQA